MDYSAQYTVWNKLVRDNIVPDLESKWIKVKYRILLSQTQLFVLLGIKLQEELEEFDKAIKANDEKQILEEGADVETVRQKLLSIIMDGNLEHVKDYYKIIKNLWQAERKVDRYIKQLWHNYIKKMEVIMQNKLASKWWFDKWIYLISTEW